jgi:hypothetical protein
MSAQNAQLIRPYFDTLISTGQPVSLSCALFNVGKGTLYRKILDAANYLVRRDRPGEKGSLCKTAAEQERYALMKIKFELAETDEGYVIYPDKAELRSKEMEQQVQKHLAYIQRTVGPKAEELVRVHNTWRADFEEWISTADSGTEFIRDGLPLAAADIEYIKNLADQAGVGYDLSENNTKLVAVKL